MVKYLTKEGLEKLKKELEDLITVQRPEIVKRISHAASHGDLRENAGYHAAKEDQAFIEHRIKELTALIEQAQVIDHIETGAVQVGSRVILQSKAEKIEYQIVEPEEADISQNKISLKSPLGQALFGKKNGDVVREYKIIGIK